MKGWIGYGAGLIVLALTVFLRLLDPPAIEQVRLYAFDRYQQFKPRTYQPVPVRVVDIDDDSLSRYGQFPWPRTLLADVVQRLTDMGAAVIAMDILFAEPDRTSPAELAELLPERSGIAAIQEQLRLLPNHDEIFAKTLAGSRVITGFVLTDGTAETRPLVKAGFAAAGDDPRHFLHSFTGSVPSLPLLEDAAVGTGALNMVPQQDGVVRLVPLLMQLDDELYPSLTAEVLRVGQGASTYVVKASGASGEQSFGEKTGITRMRIGGLEVPTDADGQFRLHYTETVPERVVPVWKLMEPEFDPKPITGHIVFLGTSAAGLRDYRPTPLNPAEIGVLIHAQAVEQMILGEFLVRPDWAPGAELMFLIAIGTLLVFLLPRFGPGFCAVIGGVAAVAAFVGSWIAFDRADYLFDPVYPAFGTLSIYLAQSLVIYLQTERERGQVRSAFSRYLAPEMVEQLTRDPSRLRLGGEMRPMTILFCDIRGFTTISETMDAESLTLFINQFLTPMTETIMARGGTIDKYMGDAIMAFWNAPLDDTHHEQNAATSALEMIGQLGELNRVWREEAEAEGRRYHEVAIGIGLNTGICCVGNLGSDQRFDYSVLGDSVNTASRLEGQSKTYGMSIVIGPETEAALPDHATLELDLIRVKGKTEPLRIYGLLGDPERGETSDYKALRQGHEAMLAAYRAQDWDRAEEALDRCAESSGTELGGLIALYRERIAAFREEPPGDDWDGVFEAKTK